MKTITANKLNKRQQEYLIIDIREDNERIQEGHITNDIHIPLSEGFEAYSNFFTSNVGKKIVFYCTVGETSENLINLIEQFVDLTDIDVFNLDGGYIAWQGLGKEVVSSVGK